MNAPVAGLTSDGIERYLRESRVDEETVASVRSVVDACDAARYAAATATAERGREIAARTRRILAAIERGER
jgi:hypothetical protein